jgi:TolB protein
VRKIVVLAGLALLAVASPADAAFPGANGRIAFQSDRSGVSKIYTANPDGTDVRKLAEGPYSGDQGAQNDPAWSPDGTQVAFFCAEPVCIVNTDGTGWHTNGLADGTRPAWSPDGTQLVVEYAVDCSDPARGCDEPILLIDIVRVNVDGSGFTDLSAAHRAGTYELFPAWSPDGTKIEFDGEGTTMNPDGTSPTCCNHHGHEPAWSPDGSKLAYERGPVGANEIYAANANGSGETRLTNNAVDDVGPAWSPDGKQIAFASNEGGDYEIFVMNADGSGRHAITSNTAEDRSPDWQPIPLNYARPRGAGPFLTYLVPAYKSCTAPNGTHGTPLAFGSCAPPAQASSQLTVGTPDANGHAATTVAAVRYSVMPHLGDVRITASLAGVLTAGALTPYSGELSLDAALRITDRDNAPNPGGPGPATVEDASFSVAVPCASGSCSVATTANAVAPGAVVAGDRAIWELGQVRLYDGGTDGVASTSGDNTLFMVEGLFTP